MTDEVKLSMHNRKPVRALGVAYWSCLGLALLGALGFSGFLFYFLPGSRVGMVWPIAGAYLLAALWLGVSAAWGRDRQKIARTLEGDAQEKAFRQIRRWCWGTLIAFGVPGIGVPVFFCWAISGMC